MQKNLKQCDTCVICGEQHTPSGIIPHSRKHVRDGSLVERKEDGKIIFYTTGNEPRQKYHFAPSWSTQNTLLVRRKPVTARSDGHNISIKCRKCNKWIKVKQEAVLQTFVDDRFLRINHCDTMSLFPKRLSCKLHHSPNCEVTE